MMPTSSYSRIVRLFRFLRLFEVTYFRILSDTPECVRAVVAWEEDLAGENCDEYSYQEIRWAGDDSVEFSDALTLGELAQDLGHISSDIIRVDQTVLGKVLGWSADRLGTAKEKLLSIRVWMVDDGRDSDFFFFHE